jgi:hypothetical protein
MNTLLRFTKSCVLAPPGRIIPPLDDTPLILGERNHQPFAETNRGWLLIDENRTKPSFVTGPLMMNIST